MVPTASASPVTKAFAALNEISPAILMKPGVNTDVNYPTPEPWPSEVGIPGFPNAHLGFHQFGPKGTYLQQGGLKLILKDKVNEWKAGAGMSI